MIDLHRYFVNPFDKAKLGLDALLAFTTDHLQRMLSADPGGTFAERIAATTAALAAVNGSTTEDSTKLGVRRARKQAKGTFRRALPEALGKLHGAAAAKFGLKGAGVKECFPKGRKIFARCPDDELGLHLQAMVAGLTARQADVGATVVAEAEALRANWKALYDASESSTAVKAKAEGARRTAREALQLELFLNLLALAAHFPRQPERLDQYMQPSLLVKRRKRAG